MLEMNPLPRFEEEMEHKLEMKRVPFICSQYPGTGLNVPQKGTLPS